MAKIVVDQLMFTPLSICVFYSALTTMEGHASRIKQTIREKFLPTLLAGYAVWCELCPLIIISTVLSKHVWMKLMAEALKKMWMNKTLVRHSACLWKGRDLHPFPRKL